MYVPVASNVCVVPAGKEGDGGVTVIDTSAAGVTVRIVPPLTFAYVAVIVVAPAAVAIAKPFEPGTFEMIASGLPALMLVAVHVTAAVTSLIEPSVSVAVAVNCWIVPTGLRGSAGVTSTDTIVAAVTLSVAVAETSPLVARMVLVPTPLEVANPVLDTVAVPVTTLHETLDVRSA